MYGLQVLALALGHLTSLDLNGCTALRQLELRCPALLTANLPHARLLPPPLLPRVLAGCPALQVLDVQHTRDFGEAAARAVAEGRAAAGAGGPGAAGLGLRSVLWCGAGCKSCVRPHLMALGAGPAAMQQ